jgi:microsomal dipeptidase-like Zn-dependent dipeptidase
MKNVIADIHCHPTMKPYGRSHPGKIHGTSTKKKDNIYYYNPHTLWDKLKNKVLGLTGFSQANFTALRYGGVNIIFASLYPLEKGFCRTEVGTGNVMDSGLNLVTGLGKSRINAIQDLQNGYYSDAELEYEFLKAQHGKVQKIDNKKVVYNVVSSYNEIIHNGDDDVFYINVFNSIEGAHIFYSNFNDIGHDNAAIRQDVFDNIEKMKNWEHTPVFITFAHHFWNGFCGHESSLNDFFVKLVTNQKAHLGEPINDLGKEVIRRMLNKGKKRILVDIKHMSEASRQDYFKMLDNEYAQEAIPIVVSHGAVRGNETNKQFFLDEAINFSDDELVRVGRSKGLFGIQLDERRIASKSEISNFKQYTTHTKVLYHAAELIWRQVRHIAEVLDNAGLFAWGVQSIGSDYDGIVNPIDGLWTSEQFMLMEPYLLMHTNNYVKSEDFKKLKNSYNKQIDQEEILSRFMGNNVLDFLKENT